MDSIDDANSDLRVERFALRMWRSQCQQHRHPDADNGSTGRFFDSGTEWRRNREPGLSDGWRDDLLQRRWERTQRNLSAL